LARTNLRTKIYYIAFWWVFLSMYIIKVCTLCNMTGLFTGLYSDCIATNTESLFLGLGQTVSNWIVMIRENTLRNLLCPWKHWVEMSALFLSAF